MEKSIFVVVFVLMAIGAIAVVYWIAKAVFYYGWWWLLLLAVIVGAVLYYRRVRK